MADPSGGAPDHPATPILKVVVVEDDPLLLQKLSEALEGAPDMQLVAAAASAEALLERLDTLDFKVALIDLGLPGMSGQELIAHLHQHRPQAELVAHTIFETPDTVVAAVRAGASGYLVKGLPLPRLLDSLRSLDEGGAPLTPRIARIVIQHLQTSDPSPLTGRESQVLQHLADGYAYKEIAESMVVSTHTVHTHVKNIYQKLAVTGRKAAVHKARQAGWLN